MGDLEYKKFERQEIGDFDQIFDAPLSYLLETTALETFG